MVLRKHAADEAEERRLAGLKPGDQPIPDFSGPLPIVGPDLGAIQAMGTTLLIDFVRDERGDVGWIRFAARLVPRTD